MSRYDGYEQGEALQRAFLQRLTFVGVLLALGYNMVAHTLVSQLHGAVLYNPNVDVTFWMFLLVGLPQFLVQHYWAGLVFDVLLVGTALASAVYVERYWFVRVFTALYFVFNMVIALYGTHHIHSKLAPLFLGVAFCTSSLPRFYFLWEFVRYYNLFIYFSAFAWKCLRGTMFYTGQLTEHLKMQNTTWLANQPDSIQSAFCRWAIAHPHIMDGMYWSGMVLEAVFLVGFFTRRYDYVLLVLSVGLHILNWQLLHVNFIEFLLLNVTLVPLWTVKKPDIPRVPIA
jgi:hypothetical protein